MKPPYKANTGKPHTCDTRQSDTKWACGWEKAISVAEITGDVKNERDWDKRIVLFRKAADKDLSKDYTSASNEEAAAYLSSIPNMGDVRYIEPVEQLAEAQRLKAIYQGQRSLMAQSFDTEIENYKLAVENGVYEYCQKDLDAILIGRDSVLAQYDRDIQLCDDVIALVKKD